MADRREALKIIGAIGTTCAFPFSADELYGQRAHSHGLPAAAALPPAPRFFTAAEFATVSRIADLIIPATDTPGALAAGAPAYIDFVVMSWDTERQKPVRAGLEWLDETAKRRFDARFVELSEARQIEILTPLSEAVDRGQAREAGERMFEILKALTADGYYTSRFGLVGELGYSGNTVLAEFPEPKEH